MEVRVKLHITLFVETLMEILEMQTGNQYLLKQMHGKQPENVKFIL
jgi:hypothetical protein